MSVSDFLITERINSATFGAGKGKFLEFLGYPLLAGGKVGGMGSGGGIEGSKIILVVIDVYPGLEPFVVGRDAHWQSILTGSTLVYVVGLVETPSRQTQISPSVIQTIPIDMIYLETRRRT